jgi:putative sugar O-methyltransferase
LGGFGYEMRGELYNEDTLRFFAALVALQDGALLADYRHATQRRLVWEIGGGWGGFAYQFKTVCPNVTYLITGIPEVLLVSAVYLTALFPAARCRFYDESAGDGLWDDWESLDFVFVPESAVPTLRPPRLDLAVDIMTLVQMRPERVCAHIRRAFDSESRYFYSLLPRRAKARESAMVWRAVERFYWPQPVPARDDPDPGLPSNADAVKNIEYVHLVGWRRVRA